MSGINSQQKFNPYGLLARGGYYDEFSSQLNSNIRVKQDLEFWKWSKGLSASAMVAFDTYNSRKRKYNRNEPMYTFAGKTDENGILNIETTNDPRSAEKVILQCADPTITGGLGNSISYKWFDLNFNVNFSFGAWNYDGAAGKLDHGGE